MPEKLQYLLPTFFNIDHNGFIYEVIVCNEYYADASEGSTAPGNGIDFIGNF